MSRRTPDRATRRNALALAVVLVVVLSVIPGVVAAEGRSGGTVVVEDDETVDEDLRAFGGTVIVRGTVDGDLTAFGGTVVVEGTVEGTVQSAAGSVRIAGSVGENVSATAGTVDVAETARIGGTLEAAAGDVAVAGRVDGDARLAGESIRLADSASIAGDVAYDGDLSQSEDATVDGTVARDESLSIGPGGSVSVPDGAFAVYGTIVTLLAGAIGLLAFPRFSAGVAERAIDGPVRSGATGLLAIVLGVVGFIALVITIVGIPLALAGGLLFVLLAWLGAVYGRFVLGTWLLSLVDVESRWLALLVGVGLVAALGFVPIVDPIVRALVFLLGFGALVRGLVRGYRRLRDRPDEPETSEASDAAGDGDAATA